MTGMTPRRVTLWSALVGMLAGLVTLAIAEAIAAIMVLPSGSPLFGVGSFVIDIVPGWFKTFVIAVFGTGDKIALFVALGILVLVLAVGIGILQYRRSPWGLVALAAVGVVAILAVVTRAESNALSSIPTLVGVVGGAIVLRIGTDRLHRWTAAVASGPERAAVTRRGFLVMFGATTAGAVVVGLGARAMNAGTTAVNTVREALKLPAPTTPMAPVPAGASLGIPGITSLISSNETFYRIDTALQVPVIDADTWKLKVTGMVEREVEISFAELLALPLTEHMVTLMCVSNEVGGNLVGNATWLGYPIRELLRQAGPLAGADMVLSTSIDGFTAGTPLDVLLEEDRQSLLAVGMNGVPLPIEHGFPVRMVVPGLYGYVSATKWVVELTVTTFADDMGYWTPRGWSALGPVKTASRIDVLRTPDVPGGPVAVGGVAWAQHRGIERVEVRIDDGAWHEATLADAVSTDTWRQWVYEWDAPSGNHLVAVRATDANGDTQGETRVPPAPNGSEGYHTVSVTIP
ncbi:MAG: molybdopterin-dependent oxidoreductase [Salinibacterium sp.]|nr:molybdopterin-dependent oxidoreductase [Salinibacterium sp.]